MTNPTNKKPLADRIRGCIERHPDWDLYRITSAVRGSTRPIVRAVMAGEPIPDTMSIINADEKRCAPTPPENVGTIDLSAVRKRYDIAAAIRREIESLPAGKLMLERELIQRTAGRDVARFRRTVENNDEFRPFRVKLRLDADHPDGVWYWGRATDIAEAIRLRDE